MIQFFHVAKRYPGGQAALDASTSRSPRGQFVFLTGASGAGKTTLLKLIFREDVPSDGQILVNGSNVSSIPRSKIPYLRRTIGVVFQDFRLIAAQDGLRERHLPAAHPRPRRRGQKKLAYQALRRVGLATAATPSPSSSRAASSSGSRSPAR